MKKIGDFICKYKINILIVTLILLIPAFIGMKKTAINYDILVKLSPTIARRVVEWLFKFLDLDY